MVSWVGVFADESTTAIGWGLVELWQLNKKAASMIRKCFCIRLIAFALVIYVRMGYTRSLVSYYKLMGNLSFDEMPGVGRGGAAHVVYGAQSWIEYWLFIF